MSAYRTATLDEVASEQWPYWMPIRHHFDIRTFGVNAWRGGPGDTVIQEHDESDTGAQELYVVAAGAATFTIGGETVEAPAGGLVWVPDAGATRSAVASAEGTLVLSVGGAAPGEPYEPNGWDSRYLEGAE